MRKNLSLASGIYKHLPAPKASVLAGGVKTAGTESLCAGGWHKRLAAQITLCWWAGTRQHKGSFLLAQSCLLVLRPPAKTGFSRQQDK
jgi:hypothetical protein